MKRFAKIGTLILKILVGGLLAFIICAMCLIVKGYNIAGEMANDILTVASEDGCINYTTLDTMMQGFKRNYETKDPSAGEEGGVSYEDAHGHDKYFMFLYDYDDTGKNQMTAYKNHIAVTSSSGKDLMNAPSADYTNIVQRGSTINVTATVYVRLYLPFKFYNTGENSDGISNLMWENLMEGIIPIEVNKSVSGVSTKFFKGDVATS